MTKNFKIGIFSLLFLLMLATTIWAGLQQSLFTEFSWTGSEMWFKTTLVDLYINQFIIWFLVCYLEKGLLPKFIWLILFICFGSMGTCAYLLLRLIKDKPLLSRGN